MVAGRAGLPPRRRRYSGRSTEPAMDMKTSPLATLAQPELLKTDAYVDGRWLKGRARFDVHDPATGMKLADVADLGPDDVQGAIDAAARAWPAWRAKTAKQRAEPMLAWFRLMQQHADDLARIMTAEQGKPLAEAKGEVAYGASFIEWFAEEGKRVYGETIPTTDPNKRFLVIRQAMGVCAAITPWNFPIAMITRKVGPALAAGCPIVVKPAGLTPLSALAIAGLAEQAGIPPGVLNLVPGSKSAAVGKVLCESDVVRHLSFTGSTAVGRVLMQQCAPTIKKLSLELGGNAPFIVFDDADLDAAAEGALASKYRNAGQTCVCANRIYAQAGIYDAFVAKLTAKAKALKVGNGFDAGVTQGPVIDDAAMQKIESHVADALAKGARIVTGGRRVEGLGAPHFYEPTVLANASADMLCAQEETFGPVAPVFRFATDDEAIAMANATEFGLAAYFYSRDIGRIFRIAEGLESGMVGINTGIISTAEVPFGGVKQSGLGREGSRHGIEDYLEMKYLCLGDILK
jgi:succinate-semialdehyde dehydrogenase/glutarate-semialdehyde dehydrogenase